MWIKGKIRLKISLTINELLEKFPSQEAELSDEKILIETHKIPFFADHKLIVSLDDRDLIYKLAVPSLGPLIFFMYLAVIFLTGFTTWKTLVVGGIVATVIAFAIYVINDKGARKYIQDHIQKLEAEEELAEQINPKTKDACPACGVQNSPYAKICYSCGLHLKGKKMKEVHSHTGNGKIKYEIKK
jgi:hypothetical protein